jgi:nucleoside-diphosphate-sugar epimerase
MRVLVTGGYGCIGSWIAKLLVERGDEVWVYDLARDERRLRQVADPAVADRVGFVPGDVTDLAALRAALDRHEISHVIHLAGLQVPVCRADPLRGARVNVLGTLAAFEAVKAARPRVGRLVYASSAAVFGQPEEYEPGAVADDAPLRPTTHYGAFKQCNEANARVYFQDDGLSSVGLRPWTVYGVGRDFGMTSEPTKALKSVALGRPYRISYGGVQDLQFAGDVAAAFLRAAEAPFEGAAVYNLRGAVVGLPEFVRTLEAVAPEARGLVTHGDRQLPIAFDLADDRFQRDFGPLPPTPLADGIRQTLERFRQLRAEGRLDVSDLG